MATVMLIHALGSSSRAWGPQIAALEDRHRVLAPDLPGHGERPGPFTLRAAVDSVAATIEGADNRACLVGISGGALVALLACLEHPERSGGLVLSAGVAHPPRWFAVQRAVMRILPEPLLARTLAGALAAGRPEHASIAAADFRRAGKRTYLDGLAEIAAVDLRPRLREVAAPALVLCGSKDRPNLPLSRELAAGMPNAEYQVVPGANHLWNLQQPEEFNQVLREFIDDRAWG